MTYNYFAGRAAVTRGIFLAGCCGLLLALSAPQGIAGDWPKPPSPFDWNGFYIGGNVGAAWIDNNIGSYDTTVDVGHQLFLFERGGPLGHSDAPTGMIPNNFGPDLFFRNDMHGHGGTDISVTGGGQVGYERQFGHFVVGVEGAFDGVASSSNEVKSRGFGTVNFDGGTIQAPGQFVDSADTNLTSLRQAETHWTGAIMGRLGYATGPFLFYGTGGVAFSGVTMRAMDSANTAFFGFIGGAPTTPNGRPNFLGSRVDRFHAEDDSVLVGYSAGGGMQYALTQICSVGVEYRHNAFGSRDYHFASPHGPIFPGNTSVNTDSDQVTFQVNFWLGHLGH
jgi:outer membrane immunogenic protein